MTDELISQLVDYALLHGLIEPEDGIWAINAVSGVLGLDSYTEPEQLPDSLPLEDILRGLLDDAVARGYIDGGIASRDLLDSRIMAALTPRPSQVIEKFKALYTISPEKATDWYYDFSRATDYIRTYRVKKDMKWLSDTEYGPLDITINL